MHPFKQDEVETKPVFLPYEFHKLPGDKVLIKHPAGLRMVRTRHQIQRELNCEEHPLRDHTSHEYRMWEKALKVLGDFDENKENSIEGVAPGIALSPNAGQAGLA